MKIINRQIKLFEDEGVKVNIRFIIKEEEKIIIAISRFKDLDEYKFIEDIKNNNDNSNNENIVIKYVGNKVREFGFTPNWNPSVEKRLKMHSIYTSTVKCDPRDEWNENTGIEIATVKIATKLAKAFDKRFKFAFRLFKKAGIY